MKTKIRYLILLLGCVFCTSIGYTQEELLVNSSDSIKTMKPVKIDGVAAVVGDYIILDSDIEKEAINLKNQGETNFTRCQLLGKLMEDKLYAHQAVQDSLLVSDDEVNAYSEQQIQYLLQDIGSMEKLLQLYKMEDEQSFREKLFDVNKQLILAGKMQDKIISEIEITPEEVRQYFTSIPKDKLPVFGAEMEIAQIVKKPVVPEEEKQKVIDELNKIRGDVLDNNSSFRVKAVLYSQDPGSKSNGGFYSINRKTQFVKEFKDVAFSLQEGEISEPFETEFGFHIIYLEKIRGQELDLRHILIVPEIPKWAIEKAKEDIINIKEKIENGEMTFAEAALEYSDQEETKHDGGMLRNPKNFDTRFELTDIDSELYNQVYKLKDDEISQPIMEVDDRSQKISYKIMQVTNRYDDHVADYSLDYTRIKDLALKGKQLDAIDDWMEEKIEDTFISINQANRDCEFKNNWLKQ